MNDAIDGKALGGWAMGRAMFDWVVANVAPDEVVLELGSGTGSTQLAKRRTLISLEHDAQWVPRSSGNAVVYAPIVDGWYDRSVAGAVFAATRPHVVLVDGPPATIGREGFLDFFASAPVDRCRAVVFDDTDRTGDSALATRFAALTGWSLERHGDGPKEFAVVSRPSPPDRRAERHTLILAPHPDLLQEAVPARLEMPGPPPQIGSQLLIPGFDRWDVVNVVRELTSLRPDAAVREVMVFVRQRLEC